MRPAQVPGVPKKILFCMLLSTTVMFYSYVLSRTTGTTVAGAVLRPVLWVIAILAEFQGTWTTGSMKPPEPQRLVTLVVIVVGEVSRVYCPR
jgi:hypothetical protein